MTRACLLTAFLILAAWPAAASAQHGGHAVHDEAIRIPQLMPQWIEDVKIGGVLGVGGLERHERPQPQVQEHARAPQGGEHDGEKARAGNRPAEVRRDPRAHSAEHRAARAQQGRAQGDGRHP